MNMRSAAFRRRVSRLFSLLFCCWGPPRVPTAQTAFVPYFGKNNIHYDTFDWHIYTTDHFEIYYYPEKEKHLERSRLRRERLSANQRRPQARPVVQVP